MTEHHPLWTGIFPISASDPQQLPVHDLKQATFFYQQHLGCHVVSQQDQPYRSVVLQRDQVTFGLAENGGNPEEHSCVIAINDLDGMYEELHAQHLDVSPIRHETHDGQLLRIFFLRAPDGLCYCFSQRVTAK